MLHKVLACTPHFLIAGYKLNPIVASPVWSYPPKTAYSQKMSCLHHSQRTTSNSLALCYVLHWVIACTPELLIPGYNLNPRHSMTPPRLRRLWSPVSFRLHFASRAAMWLWLLPRLRPCSLVACVWHSLVFVLPYYGTACIVCIPDWWRDRMLRVSPVISSYLGGRVRKVKFRVCLSRSIQKLPLSASKTALSASKAALAGFKNSPCRLQKLPCRLQTLPFENV